MASAQVAVKRLADAFADYDRGDLSADQLFAAMQVNLKFKGQVEWPALKSLLFIQPTPPSSPSLPAAAAVTFLPVAPFSSPHEAPGKVEKDEEEKEEVWGKGRRNRSNSIIFHESPSPPLLPKKVEEEEISLTGSVTIHRSNTPPPPLENDEAKQLFDAAWKKAFPNDPQQLLREVYSSLMKPGTWPNSIRLSVNRALRTFDDHVLRLALQFLLDLLPKDSTGLFTRDAWRILNVATGFEMNFPAVEILDKLPMEQQIKTYQMLEKFFSWDTHYDTQIIDLVNTPPDESQWKFWLNKASKKSDVPTTALEEMFDNRLSSVCTNLTTAQSILVPKYGSGLTKRFFNHVIYAPGVVHAVDVLDCFLLSRIVPSDNLAVKLAKWYSEDPTNPLVISILEKMTQSDFEGNVTNARDQAGKGRFKRALLCYDILMARWLKNTTPTPGEVHLDGLKYSRPDHVNAWLIASRAAFEKCFGAPTTYLPIVYMLSHVSMNAKTAARYAKLFGADSKTQPEKTPTNLSELMQLVLNISPPLVPPPQPSQPTQQTQPATLKVKKEETEEERKKKNHEHRSSTHATTPTSKKPDRRPSIPSSVDGTSKKSTVPSLNLSSATAATTTTGAAVKKEELSSASGIFASAPEVKPDPLTTPVTPRTAATKQKSTATFHPQAKTQALIATPVDAALFLDWTDF